MKLRNLKTTYNSPRQASLLSAGALCLLTASFLTSARPGVGASFSSTRQQANADAPLQAHAALAPYQRLRAYRGTLTTTTTGDSSRSPRNTTTSLLLRCDENNQVVRLRAQTLAWGQGTEKGRQRDQCCTLIYDGARLEVLREGSAGPARFAATSVTLSALLELPPMDALWRPLAPRRDDAGDERCVRAQVGSDVYTLVMDTAAGKLRRYERLSGRGGQRVQTVSELHDMAFDAAADATDARFALAPASTPNASAAVPLSLLPR